MSARAVITRRTNSGGTTTLQASNQPRPPIASIRSQGIIGPPPPTPGRAGFQPQQQQQQQQQYQPQNGRRDIQNNNKGQKQGQGQGQQNIGKLPIGNAFGLVTLRLSRIEQYIQTMKENKKYLNEDDDDENEERNETMDRRYDENILKYITEHTENITEHTENITEHTDIIQNLTQRLDTMEKYNFIEKINKVIVNFNQIGKRQLATDNKAVELEKKIAEFAPKIVMIEQMGRSIQEYKKKLCELENTITEMDNQLTEFSNNAISQFQEPEVTEYIDNPMYDDVIHQNDEAENMNEIEKFEIEQENNQQIDYINEGTTTLF